MAPSQMSKLTTICAISATVPSSLALTTALNAASSLGLFSRDNMDSNTCSGNSDLTPCGGALPSDFCCASGTTCMPLNNNTAAICCPQGKDCNVIQPISCDTSQQNATLYPASSLHSTDLNAQLPSCGSNECCPLGYNCQDGGCWMDKGNANASSTSTPPPPASYTAPVAHPSETSAAGDTSSSPAPSPSNGISPGGAAAAAFFPALFLGIALAFLGLWLYRKRREKNVRKPKELRHSDSLSHTTRNVSDPIYDPRFGNRTDFLASSRSASDYAAEMTASNPYAAGALPPSHHGGSQPASGARSDYSFDPSPPPRTPGTSTSDRVRSIFSRTPRTPVSPRPPVMAQRHNSGETIDVLMPPQPTYGNGQSDGYGLTPPGGNPARNTTFSSMMEQAGFKQSDLTGKGSGSQPRSGGRGDESSARAPAVSPRSRYV